jgi:hypothetical protein
MEGKEYVSVEGKGVKWVVIERSAVREGVERGAFGSRGEAQEYVRGLGGRCRSAVFEGVYCFVEDPPQWQCPCGGLMFGQPFGRILEIKAVIEECDIVKYKKQRRNEK